MQVQIWWTTTSPQCSSLNNVVPITSESRYPIYILLILCKAQILTSESGVGGGFLFFCSLFLSPIECVFANMH